VRICVYCGAQEGSDPAFRAAAAELGRALAARDVGLVYGGGSVGLMGVLADAVLAAGGRVTGVIPGFLATKELLHAGLTEQIVVGSMHERKRTMFDRSDAFIVLPGGFGTLDETLEMITWRQLGRHERPIVLLNVAGFFDSLVAHFERAIATGFVRPELRALYAVAGSVEEALARAGVASPAEPPLA
jgi:uncharacterized protein (TIGR00730 family)